MTKKHKIKIFILLVFILGYLIITNNTYALEPCPFGRINDPAPGQCNLFIDQNNNQICDRSEPALTENSSAAKHQQRTGSSKSLISIWALFLPLSLYFLHWFAVNQTALKAKKGFFSKQGIRYYWNLVLLLLFVPAGIFGLLIGLGIKSNFLTYWHYQGGSSFFIISTIHIANHIKYYLKN